MMVFIHLPHIVLATSLAFMEAQRSITTLEDIHKTRFTASEKVIEVGGVV